MKNQKKGFTLTELLIALGVIGIIVAILVPIIFNLIPDQSVLMAKRAYYSIQTVVSDLINDEGCYPDKTQSAGADRRVGFDDGYGYANCLKWGGSNDTRQYINSEDAVAKFATLFADKIDLKEGSTTSSSQVLKITNFETKDGMKWYIYPFSGYGGSVIKNKYNDLRAITDLFAIIEVDVNGDGNTPNCGQSVMTSACEGTARNFDQFAVALSTDGKLTILDGWARSAVKVGKDLKGLTTDSEGTIAARTGESFNIKDIESEAQDNLLQKINEDTGKNYTSINQIEQSVYDEYTAKNQLTSGTYRTYPNSD